MDREHTHTHTHTHNVLKRPRRNKEQQSALNNIITEVKKEIH